MGGRGGTPPWETWEGHIWYPWPPLKHLLSVFCSSSLYDCKQCPILIFYSVGRGGDWRHSKRFLRTWKLQEIRELSVSSQVNFCLRSFLQRPLAERSSRLARGDAWRSGESSEGRRHRRGHRRAAWGQPWSDELWELRVWRQGGKR